MTPSNRIDHSHDFGSQVVAPQERDLRIRETFRRLAPHYARLLDVHSLGLHRYWRRVLVRMMAPCAGQHILDLAGGRGEMARRLAAPERNVVVLDPCIEMMQSGRPECPQNIAWVAGLARALPVRDASMDAVVCAFGMRNVTYVEPALSEVLRVLKPRGCFYCLEVSRPWAILRPLYRAYCRHLVPRLGRWVINVPEAFDYLAASILEFPDKNACKRLFEDVGFTDVYYRSLSLGTVCIHVGTKAA